MWRDSERDDDLDAAIAELEPNELPLVRLPGGTELRNPSNGQLSRALGVGLELESREEVDLAVIGGGPAGLGAAVYGASEGLETLVVESTVLGGQAGASRRIENYLGFPGGISGTELISRAIPRRASSAPGRRRRTARSRSSRATAHTESSSRRARDRRPRDRDRHRGRYRRLPVAGLEDYEGVSIFYAAGPPEARSVRGHPGGGRRRRQLRGQRRCGLPAAAPGDLLHRRADLRETMSEYLLPELDRYGVAVRDRSEVVELHGAGGELEGVTLKDGARLPFGSMFCFLGADPCTDWIGDVVARDEHGFILTGEEAGAAGLHETSVPGIYAAGDVRAGSTKRGATAVGEGAAVVGFIQRAARKRSRLSACQS